MILGIVVLKENEDDEDKSVKVIVSNHVSLLDHFAIHLIRNTFSVNLRELPTFFHHAFNYKDLGGNQNQDLLARNVNCHLHGEEAIDIQPEMGITSGEKGLLRFVLCLPQPQMKSINEG